MICLARVVVLTFASQGVTVLDACLNPPEPLTDVRQPCGVQNVHPLTDMPDAHEDVTTSYYFPE
jgi:hypothetical protein